jgi:hypothetical protein
MVFTTFKLEMPHNTICVFSQYATSVLIGCFEFKVLWEIAESKRKDFASGNLWLHMAIKSCAERQGSII